MMKRKSINLIFFAVSMAVMLIITLVFLFAVHPVPSLQASENIELNGKRINGFRIEELGELQMITDVLYTPNEYTMPGTITGEPTTLSETAKLAPRGTIQFVFFNLDPMDKDFINKKKKLAPYLEGDKCWHFSLYLPACFSACNIYINNTLEMRVGDLENYNFIEYSEYTGSTVVHKNKTQPVELDLSFYSVRRGIPESLEERAKVVTVHYESTSEIASAPFADTPLVGSRNAVTRTVSSNVDFLVCALAAAALIAAILAFNCFLKRSFLLLPQLLSVFGVAGVMLGKYFLFKECSLPYLWPLLMIVSSWVIIISATTNMRVKIGKFPLWLPFTALASVGLILNVLLSIFPLLKPFVAVPLRVLLITVGVALAAAGVISSLQNSYAEGRGGAPAVVMFCFCMAFLPYSMPVLGAPQTWLLLSLLGIIVLTQFAFFMRLEQQNILLTNNLQNEVTLRTQSLQNLLNDRDKILRYLSHDLKKTVSSIRRYLTDLKQHATKSATRGKLEIVENKVKDIDDSLKNIATFSRRTFATEQPSKLDVNKILQKQYALLAPDCEANNILLHVSESSVTAFAKHDTLVSVINNLIFNAIEHADCKNIYLSASYSYGACKITVADDGKGIREEDKLFKAYETENPEGKNLGLGLYLCKQHLKEMGGDLIHERMNGRTVFAVILPIA